MNELISEQVNCSLASRSCLFASAMEMFLVVLAVFRRVVHLQRVGSAWIVGGGAGRREGWRVGGGPPTEQRPDWRSVAAAASSAALCVLLLIHFCQLLNWNFYICAPSLEEEREGNHAPPPTAAADSHWEFASHVNYDRLCCCCWCWCCCGSNRECWLRRRSQRRCQRQRRRQRQRRHRSWRQRLFCIFHAACESSRQAATLNNLLLLLLLLPLFIYLWHFVAAADPCNVCMPGTGRGTGTGRGGGGGRVRGSAGGGGKATCHSKSSTTWSIHPAICQSGNPSIISQCDGFSCCCCCSCCHGRRRRHRHPRSPQRKCYVQCPRRSIASSSSSLCQNTRCLVTSGSPFLEHPHLPHYPFPTP